MLANKTAHLPEDTDREGQYPTQQALFHASPSDLSQKSHIHFILAGTPFFKTSFLCKWKAEGLQRIAVAIRKCKYRVKHGVAFEHIRNVTTILEANLLLKLHFSSIFFILFFYFKPTVFKYRRLLTQRNWFSFLVEITFNCVLFLLFLYFVFQITLTQIHSNLNLI